MYVILFKSRTYFHPPSLSKEVPPSIHPYIPLFYLEPFKVSPPSTHHFQDPPLVYSCCQDSNPDNPLDSSHMVRLL